MSDITRKSGTAKVWKNAGGDYAITLNALANNAARQGAKGDLGATRADEWMMTCEFEWGAAPTAGNAVEVYWSASPHATAGTQNDGAANGTDAAYQTGNEDAFVKQLQRVGVFVVTNNATLQQVSFPFRPMHRYGQPVVLNKSGQAFVGNDTNQKITMTPIVGDIT